MRKRADDLSRRTMRLMRQTKVRRGVRNRIRDRIGVPRVTRALTGAEVARLLAAAPDARTKFELSCAVHNGLRCIEVASLRPWDINVDARTITVSDSDGRSSRVVPLSAETAAYWTILNVEDPTGSLLSRRGRRL